MDDTAHGVILRTRPLTETSLIIQWLTPEQGRLSTVAKSARRAKSVFRGKLDLLVEADFSFRRSRRSELHTLREVSVKQTHPSFRDDIQRLQLLAYATHLIESSTETEHALPGTHAIITSLLSHLDHHPTRPALVFALEIKFLNELGLGPAMDNSGLDDGTRQLLEHLAILNWDVITELKPSRTEAETANRYLGSFILDHLGKIPKGREVAIGR